MYLFKDELPQAVENLTEKGRLHFLNEIEELKEIITYHRNFYEDNKDCSELEQKHLKSMCMFIISMTYNGIHNRYIFLGLEDTEKAEHYKNLYFKYWKKFCEIDDTIKNETSKLFTITENGVSKIKRKIGF